MTNNEIRLKFHREGIADRATAAVRERAGGEEAIVKTGAVNVAVSVLEEVYLMGWKDAKAAGAFNRPNPSPLYKINRDRIVKPLKEGEIDREAIDNAKDVGKLDISVLGLSKRVYFKLQERGIRTIGELMATIDRGLKKVRGIGDVAYQEIIGQVKKAGITICNLS